MSTNSDAEPSRRPRGLNGLTLRAARAEEMARCQDIAVTAWAPIYAHRRELIGDTLFQALSPQGLQRKAVEIAGAFERHLEWILVAVAPEEAMHPDGASPPGLTSTPEEKIPREAVSPGEPLAPGAPKIVGFATYRLDLASRVGTIGNNAVDPAWQGQGIAGLMYRRLLELFREAGMQVAAVTTGLDEAHAPARAAYRKVGFIAEVPSVTLYQAL